MDTRQRRYRATVLADVMRRQGRRNDWLAGVAKVSEATITRFLRGERTIDEAVALRIADAFQLPVNVLFELSDERESLASVEAVS